MMLSEIFGRFGDFENFVNVIGKDCGEVRSRVPGHVGAEGDFTDILGVLYVPDLRHAAPGPGQRDGGGKKMRREIRNQNSNFLSSVLN